MNELTPSASTADFFSRDVAQPGRALAWGARGRQFKSARPDQIICRDVFFTIELGLKSISVNACLQQPSICSNRKRAGELGRDAEDYATTIGAALGCRSV